jgi:hypothetical protein
MRAQLVGTLLDGHAVHQWMSQAIAAAYEATICSAYIRSEALSDVLLRARVNVTGRVLVRWRKGDLLAGASDLSVFDVCRDRGLRLFMRLDFHGKVYCLPPYGIVVGSSNVTLAGLGLRTGSNTEASTLVQSSADNLAAVEQFFEGSTEVNKEIVAAMARTVADANKGDSSDTGWPASVMEMLRPETEVRRLLVSQCLWSDPREVGSHVPSAQLAHDLSLLGVVAGDTPQAIQSALERTAIFQWLVSTLRQQVGCEMYFGRLSASLHDALLDDPAPSRRDVKALAQALLLWVKAFASDDFSVDQPNFSQRITLKR